MDGLDRTALHERFLGEVALVALLALVRLLAVVQIPHVIGQRVRVFEGLLAVLAFVRPDVFVRAFVTTHVFRVDRSIVTEAAAEFLVADMRSHVPQIRATLHENLTTNLKWMNRLVGGDFKEMGGHTSHTDGSSIGLMSGLWIVL